MNFIIFKLFHSSIVVYIFAEFSLIFVKFYRFSLRAGVFVKFERFFVKIFVKFREFLSMFQ